MKTIIFFLFILCCNATLHAQDLYNYLLSRGAAKMASFAHPTNTFDASNSSVTPYDNYYLLDLAYTDENSNGYPIHTIMKLSKGFGTLYIDGINTTNDNDGFPTFGFLYLGMQAILEAAKENNPDDFNNCLQKMRNYLDIEPNQWNGADWALFLINFDYGCRCLGDDN